MIRGGIAAHKGLKGYPAELPLQDIITRTPHVYCRAADPDPVSLIDPDPTTIFIYATTKLNFVFI